MTPLALAVTVADIIAGLRQATSMVEFFQRLSAGVKREDMSPEERAELDAAMKEATERWKGLAPPPE